MGLQLPTSRRWVVHVPAATGSDQQTLIQNLRSEGQQHPLGWTYILTGMRREASTHTVYGAAPTVRMHGYVELNRSVTLSALNAEYPRGNWRPATLSAVECMSFIQALCVGIEEGGVVRAERLRNGGSA